MGMSEISEYFQLYFFLTVLFFLFLRQKLYSNRQLASLFFRSIILGAIAPFFMLIMGGIPTLIVLGAGIVVLAVLFMVRQINRHSGAAIEDTSPVLASLSLTSPSLVQEEVVKEDSAGKTESVVEIAAADEHKQADQAQRLRDLSPDHEPAEVDHPIEIEPEVVEPEAVEHEDPTQVEESVAESVADEPKAEACEEEVEELQEYEHEPQPEPEPFVVVDDESSEEASFADAEVVTEEEIEEKSEESKAEEVVPQIQLTEEERRQVNSYYLKAVEAAAKEDYASAVGYFREALSYPLLFEARYMITVDYEKALKHFGLYGKIRAEWNELLRQLDTGCMTGQIREKYEADIIRRVHYLEELDAALRRYGKPSLPWSLVPTAVRSEVDKAISEK
ncbi:hypothetical protein [Aneurinibacillus uraniidurans]|uniref:hypothetical protein n=1 Tax=Aneurinibacillus uraniidurans TaxID=2966586 RepID=UPI00234AB5F4|nr:hypothetical protein [Aneurinibacillus sp. B1]WCN37275.1 hypothetical protein PO771_15725 [Aneurinibacillus sp. B1]